MQSSVASDQVPLVVVGVVYFLLIKYADVQQGIIIEAVNNNNILYLIRRAIVSDSQTAHEHVVPLQRQL